MPQTINPLRYPDGEPVRIFGIAMCTLDRDDGGTSVVAVADPDRLAGLTEPQVATIARWARAYLDLRDELPPQWDEIRQVRDEVPAECTAAGRILEVRIYRPDAAGDTPTLIASPRGAA